MIRILIVDDAPLLIESFKLLLEKDNFCKVIATAENGKMAVEICESLKPELILMDIVMPICDGIEATRLIKEKYPEIKVIMLTTFEEDEMISMALKNGADGYILKDITPKALRSSIKSVIDGMPIIHPNIIKTIVRQFEVNIPAVDKDTNIIIQKYNKLTQKDKLVVSLIVEGNSNRDIAGKLFLSEGRVKNIISEILNKLEFADRTQLAVFVVKNRLV